jgi:hypothetical protein
MPDWSLVGVAVVVFVIGVVVLTWLDKTLSK